MWLDLHNGATSFPVHIDYQWESADMTSPKTRIIRGFAILVPLFVSIVGCEPKPPPQQPQLATLHYKCYDLPRPPAEPYDPGPIRLVTQFPPERVQLGRPLNLCAPVLKNGHGTLDQSPDLKCYAIIGGNSPQVQVKLESTQFPTEKLNVGPAIALCTPVNKVEVPSEPPHTLPRDPHYKCYTLLDGKPPGNGPVNLRTLQFPEEKGVTVGSPRTLCVPALKNPTGGKDEQQRDLERLQSIFPHLKCYELQGNPPGKRVNLRTQFGVERNVDVGRPNGLCAPVKKTVLPGGGPDG